MNSRLREWIWFANLKGIITRKKNELLELFGTPALIYEADAIALAKTGILNRENIEAILSTEPRKTVDETMEKLVLNNISVITQEDEAHPELLKHRGLRCVCVLKEISNGGNVNRDSGIKESVGVWDYNDEKISSELAEYGICVISGMARGIDMRTMGRCLQAAGL